MSQNKQNPLGIIAIFASLAEVFGTVVLKFLPVDIQRIFVWFVIGFPVLTVLLFFYLLYKKPENYYSPDYYKNDKNFLAAILHTQREILDVANDVMLDDSISEEVKEKLQQKLTSVEEQLGDLAPAGDEVLTITINGDEITASSVKAFYQKIFAYLSNHHVNFDHLIPYKTGNKRYLISKDGRHIQGNAFLSPLLLDGYYVETHKSKAGAKQDISKFLNALQLTVS